MSRREHGLARLGLFGLGLLFVGCSLERGVRYPETGATLEGTIKYGNEPVGAAMVIVAGANGSANGTVDEVTGRYKVENAPLGEVRIGVNTEAAKGMLTGKMMSGYYNGPEAKSKKLVPPKIVEVPAKYSKPETSGITTTVNKGENTFDIVIPK